MVFAQVGPLTAIFEGFAAAVGAGIVLGSFVLAFTGSRRIILEMSLRRES
jgi:hypothetical protein